MKLKNTIFLFFVVLLFLSTEVNLFSQNQCYLLLNPNDCIKCLAFSNEIGKFNIDYHILMDEKYKRSYRNVLLNQLQFEQVPDNVVFEQGLYDQLISTSASSKVYILDQNEIRFSCLLKEVVYYLPVLNAFMSQMDSCIVNVQDVNFTTRAELELAGNTIIINNYPNREVFTFDIESKSCSTFFDFTDSLVKDLYSNYEGGLKVFNWVQSNRERLDKFNLAKCHINNVAIDADGLQMAIELPWVSQQNRVFSISAKSVVLKKTFGSNTHQVLYKIQEPSKLSAVDASLNFFEHDNEFFMSYYSFSQILGSRKFISRLDFTNDSTTLINGKLTKLRLPTRKLHGEDYDFTSVIYRDEYILFRLYNRLQSLDGRKKISFDFVQSENNYEQKKLNYAFYDFKIIGDIIIVLYEDNGWLYRVVYSINEKKTLNYQQIGPKSSYWSYPILLPDASVLYIRDANQISIID